LSTFTVNRNVIGRPVNYLNLNRHNSIHRDVNYNNLMRDKRIDAGVAPAGNKIIRATIKLARVLPHLKFRARALYARADAKSACLTFAEVKNYRRHFKGMGIPIRFSSLFNDRSVACVLPIQSLITENNTYGTNHSCRKVPPVWLVIAITVFGLPLRSK
jgi:hypothetical protein